VQGKLTDHDLQREVTGAQFGAGIEGLALHLRTRIRNLTNLAGLGVLGTSDCYQQFSG